MGSVRRYERVLAGSAPGETLLGSDDSGSAKSSITCVKIITLLTLIP